MNNQRRDFDKAAATWDDKPQRVQLAQEIKAAILAEVAVTDRMNVLDFGCGTGLLTLGLQPMVGTIIGADSSRGMLDVLNGKIAAAGLDNVCSLFLDPESNEPLKGGYHLIVSAMTLHHVREIEPLLARLHAALLPGGSLCLADLDLEGGRFHEDNTGVFHFGFDRSVLGDALRSVGFTGIRDRTAAEIVKPAAEGTSHRFPVFLITARKE